MQVSAFRKSLEKVVVDKHEQVMCRMGAIMATGILDAGGRNSVLCLRSRSGQVSHSTGKLACVAYFLWVKAHNNKKTN